jgi:hypothetical protein
VNSQRKSIKLHIKPIKIQKNSYFIDFVCEFTVKTTAHTVASYASSDFT